MINYDVVIIGGGIIGASIARELSRFKLQIALLEKEEELGFGVSKSNSGIIHPGTQMSPNSLKGRLCVQGNKLTRKIAKEIGADFKEVGELIVAFNQKDIQRLNKIKKDGDLLGVPGLKIVTQNWLKKNEPNINKKIIAALYAPTAGVISPYRMVYDLSENAKENGVEINTLAEVKRIKHNNHDFELVTTAGNFKSRYVINCAGLYADKISKMGGIDDFKITPRKGEEFLLDKKKEHITNHLIFPLPSKKSKGVIMIKTSDGNPMIGPTAEEIENKEDLTTSDAGLEQVFRKAKKLVPSVNPNDIIAYFAGLRPVSGSDFIIRHEDRVPGFINVAGIQSPGLTAAPAIAVFVKDILITNGLKLTKKQSFNKYRKKTTHLFDVPLSKTKQLIEEDPSYGDIVCRCEMVSKKEIDDAVSRGAKTLDGIKFRTRAQAGRCHGGFCTSRLLKILAKQTKRPVTKISKRGPGSEIVIKDRGDD